MNFDINYDKQPLKFLKKQNKNLVKRIIEKIDGLLITNPVPHNAKPIIGKQNCFRIRIGSYRALYRINYKTKKVVIFKIDKRSKVYISKFNNKL